MSSLITHLLDFIDQNEVILDAYITYLLPYY